MEPATSAELNNELFERRMAIKHDKLCNVDGTGLVGTIMVSHHGGVGSRSVEGECHTCFSDTLQEGTTLLNYLRSLIASADAGASIQIRVVSSGIYQPAVLYHVDEVGIVFALDKEPDEKVAYPWRSVAGLKVSDGK